MPREEDFFDVESIVQLGDNVTAQASNSLANGPLVTAVRATFLVPTGVSLVLWADAPNVQVELLALIGNVALRKVFPAPTVPTPFTAFGRSITVSFQTLAGAPATQCHAALAPYDVNPLAQLATTFVPCIPPGGAGPLPGSKVVVVGSGVMLDAQGFLFALGGADAGPYYLMFFDAAAVPLAGTAPLFALGPLTPGTPFAVDFSARPIVRFATGLVWAPSTTPDVYTAAAATPKVRCDVGYGQ